jgi:hypothetical protein
MRRRDAKMQTVAGNNLCLRLGGDTGPEANNRAADYSAHSGPILASNCLESAVR